MKSGLQVAILTVLAVILFVGLRRLPDTECGFLHYQAPQVGEDGLEFCGDDAPTFLDLERLRFPVEMVVSTDELPRVGEEVFFRVSFRTTRGRELMPHEFAVTHTQPLHVMVVDTTLDDYHHIHPGPLGASDQWGFTFTPAKAGEYRMVAEFVLTRTRQKVILMERFKVLPSETGSNVKPVGAPEAFPVTLERNPAVMSSRVENGLTLRFGKDVVLEPVMGALGHMVAFDETLRGMAHLHPKYTGKERGEYPELSFAFNTEQPGNYRLWAQVKIDGQERFYPFDLEVR